MSVKSKQFITKCIAFICLLALSQKMGAGLYFHNLFHNKDYKSAADNRTTKYSCNCIDDFTTPFTETSSIELPPVASFYADCTSFYNESIPFSFHFYNSLRAPPVA